MPPSTHRPDLDLATLRRAQRGDRAGTRALVEHHAPAVFDVLSRLVGPAGHGAAVEDLAQETMLRVTRAIGRFDPDGPAKLSTWVLTIATRLGLQYLQRRRLSIVGVDADPPASLGSPEAHLSAAELRARVQAEVAAMSPELRAAFVLADAHGMTPAEVAAALEIPDATARTRIHRARTRLRTLLEGDDPA